MSTKFGTLRYRVAAAGVGMAITALRSTHGISADACSRPGREALSCSPQWPAAMYADRPLPPTYLVTTDAYEKCTSQHNASLVEYSTTKHGGEVHWVQSVSQLASSVNNETRQPRALYVVGVHPGWTVRSRRCVAELQEVLRVAQAMPEFGMYRGRRHIVLFTDWVVRMAPAEHARYSSFSIATHDLSWYPDKDNVIAAPIQSIADPRLSWDETLWLRETRRPRAFLYNFVGQADGRDAYQTRRVLIPALLELAKHFPGRVKAQRTRSGTRFHVQNYSYQLADTLFGLAPRGDTPTGPKVYDALSVGCVPVLLSDDFFELTAPGLGIPWRTFTFQIKEPTNLSQAAVHHLTEQLLRLVNDTWAIQKRQQSVLRWADHLLWQSPNSRVTETMLIDFEALILMSSKGRRGSSRVMSKCSDTN